MSIYGELNPMPEHRIPEDLDKARVHMVKSNTPNTAYPSQHIEIEITKVSRDYVIVTETLKITFDFNTQCCK